MGWVEGEGGVGVVVVMLEPVKSLWLGAAGGRLKGRSLGLWGGVGWGWGAEWREGGVDDAWGCFRGAWGEEGRGVMAGRCDWWVVGGGG